MYTRADLKSLGHEYETAIKNREIDIYVKYVGEGILKYAKEGNKTIHFPMIRNILMVRRASDGLLNKHDPGPIPEAYISEVMMRLYEIFPDTDFVIQDMYLVVNWS